MPGSLEEHEDAGVAFASIPLLKVAEERFGGGGAIAEEDDVGKENAGVEPALELGGDFGQGGVDTGDDLGWFEASVEEDPGKFLDLIEQVESGIEEKESVSGLVYRE